MLPVPRRIIWRAGVENLVEGFDQQPTANRHDMLSWSRPLSGFCPLRRDFKKAPTQAERWKDPGFIINKFYVGFMWVNSKLVGCAHKPQWPSGALSLNWDGRMQKLFARKPVRRCTVFLQWFMFSQVRTPSFKHIQINYSQSFTVQDKIYAFPKIAIAWKCLRKVQNS